MSETVISVLKIFKIRQIFKKIKKYFKVFKVQDFFKKAFPFETDLRHHHLFAHSKKAFDTFFLGSAAKTEPRNCKSCNYESGNNESCNYESGNNESCNYELRV